MTEQELRQEVAEIWWYHRIDLGHGIVTPGRQDTERKLRDLSLPARLDGCSVLDIGAWDGFYSFAAERRGAARVLATDSVVWSGAEWGVSKRGFELARRALGSKVDDRVIDPTELSPEAVGTFDVVLFLGVLYHLRDPLSVLERVRSVTAGMCVVETLTDLRHVRQPAAAFYEGAAINDDPTTWFGPNPAAVAAMLRAAGFSRVVRVPPRHEPGDWRALLRTARDSARCAIRRTRPLLGPFWRGRAVFHAHV